MTVLYRNILLWLRIIRPQTFFASCCPVVVGLCITPYSISPLIATLTLVCALSLQILSNLINDYYDYVRGADQKGRDGYKRALAEGEVTKQQVKTAILITLLMVIISGITLVFYGGWRILLIGVSAILFAWLYTATRYSLSYLGIADIFVYLYYGIIATMGTTYLQGTTFFYPKAFYAGSVCGLISMCVLIINNLRDIEADRAVGKRTFPVRFGRKAGEMGMLVIILLTPLFAYKAFGMSCITAILLPLLGLWIMVVRAKSGKRYNLCLLCAGICNMLYTISVAISVFT